MGLETSQEVRKKYEAVPNPFLQGYLKRVGERLAASKEAKESGFNFQFTVVNEPSVNAFALPGGPMFVFTGLLKAVDNEAQLAGVMSHEMSHVILRHGTNQLSKANVLQLPAALAGAAAGNRTIMGQLTQAGIGFGLQSALLKFSNAMLKANPLRFRFADMRQSSSFTKRMSSSVGCSFAAISPSTANFANAIIWSSGTTNVC